MRVTKIQKICQQW
nr:truncated envelope glycoprotein precursor [Human immunodeficiency virus 1]